MTDFNLRLNEILTYFELTASQFADLTGIQRSSLSHIISERNKPSLDFILKIIETFPTVDLYWLLLGKGNMQKQNSEDTKTTFPKEVSSASEFEIVRHFTEENRNEISPKTEEKPLDTEKPAETITENSGTNLYKKTPLITPQDSAEEIILFYKDGTFKSFRSR